MNRHDATTPRKTQEPEERLDQTATSVLDAAFKVHRSLGPGLLESVYEVCMVHELRNNGLQVASQVQLPVIYEGCRIEGGLRLDLLVNNQVIIEIKTVEKFHPIHQAQLLTYLKLSGYRLGLLLNFNSALMRDGVKRIVLSGN